MPHTSVCKLQQPHPLQQLVCCPFFLFFSFFIFRWRLITGSNKNIQLESSNSLIKCFEIANCLCLRKSKAINWNWHYFYFWPSMNWSVKSHQHANMINTNWLAFQINRNSSCVPTNSVMFDEHLGWHDNGLSFCLSLSQSSEKRNHIGKFNQTSQSHFCHSD